MSESHPTSEEIRLADEAHADRAARVDEYKRRHGVSDEVARVMLALYATGFVDMNSPEDDPSTAIDLVGAMIGYGLDIVGAGRAAVRLEDCDILVGINWQPATGEGFIPGQVYRVRER